MTSLDVNFHVPIRTTLATLAILTDAGFAGEARVIAQRTIVAYLFGMLQNEHSGPLSGGGTADTQRSAVSAADRCAQHVVTAFPRLVAGAGVAVVLGET